MSVDEKVDQRWEVVIRPDSGCEVVVNSIDGDRGHVKLSVMGHISIVIESSDLIDAFRRIASHIGALELEEHPVKLHA